MTPLNIVTLLTVRASVVVSVAGPVSVSGADPSNVKTPPLNRIGFVSTLPAGDSGSPITAGAPAIIEPL